MQLSWPAAQVPGPDAGRQNFLFVPRLRLQRLEQHWPWLAQRVPLWRQV